MIEYDSERRKPVQSHLLNFAMGVNLVIALVTLTSWAVIRMTVAQPLGWATSQIIGDDPGFLDYPFVLLWAVPILAVLVARGAAKWGRREMALGTAFLAPTLFAIILGIFYFGPTGWR